MSTFEELKNQPIVGLPEGYLAKMNSPQFKKDLEELKEFDLDLREEMMARAQIESGKDGLLKILSEVNEARWKKEAEEALLDSPRLPPAMAAREKIDAWSRAWKEENLWCPLTPEELEALADEVVADHNSYQEQLMVDEPSVGSLDPVTKEHFTCYRCSAASKCLYVYDPYNTTGDCLASK